ncbi:GIY-YIG nuclease family protein [Streptomyces harbinensis]|uniref:GIY-YIG nuclease family protein n=1 Tax=Streptomyces harbinensis TaxID=1176198 RepID=UPI0036C7DCCD
MYDSIREALGPELGESTASTLQHIALIKRREEKLKAAREAAELQLVHRLGAAHRNGEIGMDELAEVHSALNELKSVGRATRWNSNIDVAWAKAAHWKRYVARYRPNGPAGSWIGDWPLTQGASRPGPRVPVVYVLFGPSNEPCYVGSTDQFAPRLNAHDKDGKRFLRWQAHPARDREHAYLMEDRLLREHKPHLNRKASR